MAIPEKFKNLANAVRNEIYGEHVREALAESIEMTGESSETAIKITEQLIDGSFDEAELITEIERKLNELEAEYAPELNGLKTEMSDARGNESSLNDRFNSVDSQLAQTAKYSNVKAYGAKGDGYTDDSPFVQQAFDNGSDYLLFESGTYKLDNIVVSKKVSVIASGEVTIIGDTGKDIFLVENEFSIKGISFEKCRRAIDTTNCIDGDLTVDSCRFNFVDFPIYMDNESVEITNADKITVKNCIMSDLVTGITSRYKKVENFIVKNNVVNRIKTDTRYAVAFRLGSAHDQGGEYLIENALVEGNFVDDVVNNGTGPDWECQCVLHHGNNLIVTNNTFQNLFGATNDNAEAVYSKGNRIIITDNVIINGGGSEGAICTKGGDDLLVSNNIIEFTKTESETSMSHIGLLITTTRKALVNGNIFKGCTDSIQSYTTGTIFIMNNRFENGVRVYAPRSAIVDDGLVIMDGNHSNNVDNFVRTSGDFRTNGRVILSNNSVTGLKYNFLFSRGYIKDITVKNNDIYVISDYSEFLISIEGYSPEQKSSLIVKDNFVSEMKESDANARFINLFENDDNNFKIIEITGNTLMRSRSLLREYGEPTTEYFIVKDNILIDVPVPIHGQIVASNEVIQGNVGLEDNLATG